jgi:hypothetical protein
MYQRASLLGGVVDSAISSRWRISGVQVPDNVAVMRSGVVSHANCAAFEASAQRQAGSMISHLICYDLRSRLYGGEISGATWRRMDP